MGVEVVPEEEETEDDEEDDDAVDVETTPTTEDGLPVTRRAPKTLALAAAPVNVLLR